MGYGAIEYSSSCEEYCKFFDKDQGLCVSADRLAVKTAYGMKVCKPCVWKESSSDKFMNTFKKTEGRKGKCLSTGYEDKSGVVLQKSSGGAPENSEWSCKTYCQDNTNKDDCMSAPLAIILEESNILKTCQPCKWEKYVTTKDKGPGVCIPTQTDSKSTKILFEIHRAGPYQTSEKICTHAYRQRNLNEEIKFINGQNCDNLKTEINGAIDGKQVKWLQYTPPQDPIPDPNNANQ